jgi:hypothetical protein
MSQTPAPVGNFQHASLFKPGRLARWRRSHLTHSGQRLANSLETYYAEMAQLETRLLAAGLEANQFGFANLARLIEQSAAALDDGQVELGWGLFNTARRGEMQIYFDLSQQASPLQAYAAGVLHASAQGLLQEANKKLGGWRKSTLNKILTQENNQLKQKLELGELLQAQQILTEHYGNVYRRLHIIGDQIRFLEGIALLAVLGWLALLLWLQNNPPEHQEQVFRLSLTVSSLLFGTLGACISGILRLEKSSAQVNIPDQLQSFVFTIARPLVGAVSALAVVIFVLAGILQMGEQTPGLYLAAAFLAGFSERLLEMGMGKAEGDDKDAKAQK